MIGSFLILFSYKMMSSFYIISYKFSCEDSTKRKCIQTYHKDHRIIKLAVSDNYDTYYENEIEIRKVLEYDPFNEISRIVIKGEDVFHVANYYKKAYNRAVNGQCLGPSYDFKIKGVKLILKHNDFKNTVKLLNDTRLRFKTSRTKISLERVPRVL